MARSVARSHGPPAAPSRPATYKHREGSGSRRSCPIGAQNHRDVDLLRAAQSRRWCGGNWLARRAPTDGPARCLSAKIVPHCERIIVSHAKHAWIADSVTQTDSAADRSFGHGGQSRAESCAPTRIVRAWARAHARPSQQSSDTRLCRGSNRRGSTGQSSQSVRHTLQGEVRACRGSLREPGEKFWDCMIGDEVLTRGIGSAEHLVRLVRRQLLHRRLVPQVAG